MHNNYFFVDGSALLGDISRARGNLSIEDSKKRFCVWEFYKYFTGSKHMDIWTEGSFRRFVIYFVQSDKRVLETLKLPHIVHDGDGKVSDFRIEYCGKRIREFERAKEWLEGKSAPPHVLDCLYRTEKAVDTQICCDAMQYAAIGKLDRLFLYTNDYDFAPLCVTLRRLGINVNLFRLEDQSVNEELAKECDAIHVMAKENLRRCFQD